MDADIFQIIALGAVMAVIVLLSMRLNRPEARAADRAREVVRDAGAASVIAEEQGEAEETPQAKIRAMIAALGDRLPLFNAKQRGEIQNLLLTGGYRQPHALSVFIAVKLACGALGGMGGVAVVHVMPDDASIIILAMLTLGGLMLGLVLPELLLNRMVKNRQRAIHKALPDALDLMVICTNAGYSLSAAIKRLSVELVSVCPPLANEFEITSHEIQMNADPVEGLRRLADRTKVESLRSLVTTLVQAHQYGTPITQSLKTLARTERTTRILLLEEKGAKLAAKLTMPMMLLILPAVMMISGGPAMLRMMEMFK
ncbi:MAG TPA: type II secretion system F family protein [Magnetospirillum sp.]|nr:type II secretion system F family protein [Magnetospirillum sp.]